jgi:hypothetical protein
MGHVAQKRRSPHGAGFVSACQHSYFLVAGARFELATWVMRLPLMVEVHSISGAAHLARKVPD